MRRYSSVLDCLYAAYNESPTPREYLNHVIFSFLKSAQHLFNHSCEVLIYVANRHRYKHVNANQVVLVYHD